MKDPTLEYCKGKFVSVWTYFRDPETGTRYWGGKFLDYSDEFILLDTSMFGEKGYEAMVIPRRKIIDIIIKREEW